MKLKLVCVWLGCLLLSPSLPAGEMKLVPTRETTLPGFVEITGVEAGGFDPALWQAGNLNLLPDVRTPLIEPRPGKFRNIYAPSAVEVTDGWRVFYGAWDGVPSGNDRIYSLRTRDFLTFTDRHTVIEHGPFIHVCNVAAVGVGAAGFAMVCTAYPDALGLNKPAFFSSPDGQTWNGSAAPYAASTNDLVRIHGYEKYAEADINGLNVLFRENETFRLYFANFKDFGRVYRASGTNGRDFQFEGVALPVGTAPNDVKKFRVGTTNWYLMGLHMNGNQTTYSLSSDGLHFAPAQSLFTNATPAERYIVAVGWVTRGEQERDGRKLLGVLYGAGAVPTLDHNRLFARWLQPRLALQTADGKTVTGTQARGPDRQLIPLNEKLTGTLQVFNEGGRVLRGESKDVALEPGHVYRLER